MHNKKVGKKGEREGGLAQRTFYVFNPYSCFSIKLVCSLIIYNEINNASTACGSLDHDICYIHSMYI